MIVIEKINSVPPEIATFGLRSRRGEILPQAYG
jgi:hypothetical protein